MEGYLFEGRTYRIVSMHVKYRDSANGWTDAVACIPTDFAPEEAAFIRVVDNNFFNDNFKKIDKDER